MDNKVKEDLFWLSRWSATLPGSASAPFLQPGGGRSSGHVAGNRERGQSGSGLWGKKKRGENLRESSLHQPGNVGAGEPKSLDPVGHAQREKVLADAFGKQKQKRGRLESRIW